MSNEKIMNYLGMLKVVKNNGPSNKLDRDQDNCVVLALSASCDVSYDQAYEYAKKTLKRKANKGVKGSILINALGSEDTENTILNKTFKRISHENEYKYKKSNKVVKCKYRLATFAKKMNQGTYYIITRNHATVIKDGNILDHTEPKTLVQAVWKVM